MKVPDKARALAALVESLNATAEQMAQAARTTREGATHAEAKPENSKDTRALEQSYLARGQAMRVEDLLEQIQVLRFLPLRTFGTDDLIEGSAMVCLEHEDGSTRWVFLAPYGGGTELSIDGVSVLVVTPQSPLGGLLLGKQQGDDVEQRVRGVLREMSIAKVA